MNVSRSKIQTSRPSVYTFTIIDRAQKIKMYDEKLYHKLGDTNHYLLGRKLNIKLKTDMKRRIYNNINQYLINNNRDSWTIVYKET